MAKSKLDKLIAILLLMCLTIGVYLGVVCVVFFRNKQLPLQVYSQVNYLNAYDFLIREYDDKCNSESKEYYKDLIEKDLGMSFYIYKEMQIECSGKAYPTIRTIVIDDDVTGYDYCMVLAHEIMHIKLFIKQEDYVCYETFKYLYESEELHNVGVWYALRQLNGYYSREYNISGHIVNYLTNK